MRPAEIWHAMLLPSMAQHSERWGLQHGRNDQQSTVPSGAVPRFQISGFRLRALGLECLEAWADVAGLQEAQKPPGR